MIVELISLTLLFLHKVIIPIIGSLIWSLWYSLRLLSDYQTKKLSPAQTKKPTQRPVKAPRLQAHPHQAAKPYVQPPATRTLQSWVKPATRQRLLAMCGGDENLVRRLTGGSGDQADWEKAIYYLERDRR